MKILKLTFTLFIASQLQSCAKFKTEDLLNSNLALTDKKGYLQLVPKNSSELTSQQVAKLAFQSINAVQANESIPLLVIKSGSDRHNTSGSPYLSSANDASITPPPNKNRPGQAFQTAAEARSSASPALRQHIDTSLNVKSSLNRQTGFSSGVQSGQTNYTGTNQNTTPCTCRQTIINTTINNSDYGLGEGTSAGLCRFQSFSFGTQVSFQGGWYETGDLSQFTCNGGPFNYVNQIVYASAPSPLCTVTSQEVIEPEPGQCTAQCDTDLDGDCDQAELAIYNQRWEPAPNANNTVEGVSNGCWERFNLAFALALTSGGASQATPQDMGCYRLNFAAGSNSECFEQIQQAFTTLPNGQPNTINNLNHCVPTHP